MKYIDSEKLLAEIKKRIIEHKKSLKKDITLTSETMLKGSLGAYESIERFITSLQQEQPDVDVENLGGIARHLIAVKYHEEDMRLDDSEWLLLERIGYPERFNARKEE